ncbi:21375_t:CDS:1, partial [Gigaspora margarita]
TQTEILNWIKQARAKNMSIIVIGNFNANPNTPHSQCTTPILHQMPTLQLTSLMNTLMLLNTHGLDTTNQAN